MSKSVKNIIIAALFVAVIVYLLLQLPFREQTRLYSKNDELFNDTMQKVTELLTGTASVKIALGDELTIEGAAEDYDLSQDESLTADLIKLRDLGVRQVNAYFYEASSDYDVSSCEVWFGLDGGKRIIYAQKGRLVEKVDMLTDGENGIRTKELRVRWRAGVVT